MTRYHKAASTCSHFQFSRPPRAVFLVKKRGPNSADILHHCIELLLYLIEIKKLCVWMEPQEVEHIRSINEQMSEYCQDINELKQRWRDDMEEMQQDGERSKRQETKNLSCNTTPSTPISPSFANDAPPNAISCDSSSSTLPPFPYYSLPAGLYSISIPVCVEEVEQMDFCITLGGDGTVLHLNWLLNNVSNIPLPPVLSFAMGTLGFLTSLYFEKFPVYIERILQCYPVDWNKHGAAADNAPNSPACLPMNRVPAHPERWLMINPRMRLYCTVWRRVVNNNNNPQSNNNSNNTTSYPPTASPQPSPQPSSAHWVQAGSYTVMNEVLIHRSASPFLTSIDIQLIEANQQQQPPKYVTTVHGDGLMVATPTGSTAYSMAAGGPMVAPSTQCMILTPVCAHSLSMRPIVLNSSTDLRLVVSPNSRVGIFSPSTVESGHSPVLDHEQQAQHSTVSSNSFAAKGSFDGHWEIHLLPGDYIQVTAARYSWDAINLHYPFFSNEALWLKSLTNKLHWNLTQQQLRMLDSHLGLQGEMDKGLQMLHNNNTAAVTSTASTSDSVASTPKQQARPSPPVADPSPEFFLSSSADGPTQSDPPAEYDVDYRRDQPDQDYSNELPTSNNTNYLDDLVQQEKENETRNHILHMHAGPLLVGFGCGILSVIAFLLLQRRVNNTST